ncbi:MAG TPA: hypothetical protein PKB15_08675 [Acidimicrobiia bacterium]|nr:hypothetical protein [Acidimicrobiia bacterium]
MSQHVESNLILDQHVPLVRDLLRKLAESRRRLDARPNDSKKLVGFNDRSFLDRSRLYWIPENPSLLCLLPAHRQQKYVTLLDDPYDLLHVLTNGWISDRNAIGTAYKKMWSALVKDSRLPHERDDLSAIVVSAFVANPGYPVHFEALEVDGATFVEQHVQRRMQDRSAEILVAAFLDPDQYCDDYGKLDDEKILELTAGPLFSGNWSSLIDRMDNPLIEAIFKAQPLFVLQMCSLMGLDQEHYGPQLIGPRLNELIGLVSDEESRAKIIDALIAQNLRLLEGLVSTLRFNVEGEGRGSELALIRGRLQKYVDERLSGVVELSAEEACEFISGIRQYRDRYAALTKGNLEVIDGLPQAVPQVTDDQLIEYGRQRRITFQDEFELFEGLERFSAERMQELIDNTTSEHLTNASSAAIVLAAEDKLAPEVRDVVYAEKNREWFLSHVKAWDASLDNPVYAEISDRNDPLFHVLGRDICDYLGFYRFTGEAAKRIAQEARAYRDAVLREVNGVQTSKGFTEGSLKKFTDAVDEARIENTDFVLAVRGLIGLPRSQEAHRAEPAPGRVELTITLGTPSG